MKPRPPHSQKPDSATLHRLVRAGIAGRDELERPPPLPLPPVEPLLARWRNLHVPGNMVAMPPATGADALALAARSGESITAETRARLGEIVRRLAAQSDDSAT